MAFKVKSISTLIMLVSICNLNSKVFAYIECPVYETHFQKIVGYYPSIAVSTINWDHLREYPSPLECLKFCQEDYNCSGFVYHVNKQKCNAFDYHHQSTATSLNDAVPSSSSVAAQNKLTPDPDIIFYEKACLNLPRECRGGGGETNKGWPILRIPAAKLIGAGFKHINRLVTRRHCIELCLAEQEFTCKSASFRFTYRNNYNRGRERDFAYRGDDDSEDVDEDVEKQVGECILSREDKNSKPDAFRVSNDVGEEYIENQCVAQDFVENQCSYERYLNASFLYADDVIVGLTEKECQERCDLETRFKCIGLGYSLGNRGRSDTSKCTLHSDDIISLGPRSVRSTIGSVYMRRVRCLNIHVICDGAGQTMLVRYLPDQYFVGKLYVNAASRKNCSSQSTTDMGLLRIPIGDETRENSCGIVRAYQLTAAHNRTLISTTIVIQNHPSVQSQGDRLIKVGCILSGENENDSDDGSGKSSTTASGADRQSKVLDVVDSHIQVAGLNVPNTYTPPGRSSQLRPIVQLVDVDNNILSKVVEVGQNLQLRVFYADDIGYDVEVLNLKATSPTSGQEIYLLDYKGCPIDETIFPEMLFTDIDGHQTLVGQFVAFKFAEGAYIDFSMTVRSCYKNCPEHNCPRRVAANYKKTRREKRQSSINPVAFPSGTEVLVATATSSTLAPITFPLPTIVFPTNKYLLDKQEVDEENSSSENRLDNIDNIVYQRVISSFDEPLDDKVRKLGETSSVEIKEWTRDKIVEFPITIRVQVYSTSDSVSPASLIYGENSFSPSLAVDGTGSVGEVSVGQSSNAICVDQTFILCLLLFFAILVIVLVIGCALMWFRYKRKLKREEDLNSLHRFQFDSLSRRVHWADGFATAQSAYP